MPKLNNTRAIRFLTLTLALALALFAAADSADAVSEPVTVVMGPNAPELEQFAARELCGYLEKLFGIQVKPTTTIPSAANEIFLIGNPETNPLIPKREFPTVSDQGVVLKSVKVKNRSAIIVGGGSSRATLWAVYALAEKWDVRFLLHGDVLPARAKFKMPSLNLQEEPALRVRQWRVLNEHAMGPISWGIADYRPVIDQLAKLRFNRLLLYIWPGQPFLPLEYRGIKQTSGTLFFGNHYPITDDMIGRSLFGSEKEFWNPDLPLPGDSRHCSNERICLSPVASEGCGVGEKT
ncbi:MAG: alpha-glucuronidase family glycosyl hydrolase [Limisphaerales bacterium]